MSEHTASSCNILTVSVETNCPRGGDTGHGGRTKISFKDESSTNLSVDVDGQSSGQVREVTLLLGGDTEAETMAECLLWAGAELAGQQRINRDMERWPQEDPKLRSDKLTLTVNSLESLLDDLSLKGVSREEMLAVLLRAYVFGMTAAGCREPTILAEVSKEIRRFYVRL